MESEEDGIKVKIDEKMEGVQKNINQGEMGFPFAASKIPDAKKVLKEF